MLSRRLSRLVFAVVGAVALTASPAYAHSGHQTSFTATSYALNANANYTVSFVLGANEADTAEIDFEAGIKFAHDDQYGNELFTNPNDGDKIGSGQATAAWVFALCLTATVNIDIYFDEDMTGAPVGAVAHWRAVAATVGTYNTWVIEQNDANDDYKLVSDLDASLTCSTQPSSTGFTVTFGAVQNPGASDCKVVTVTVIDTNGVAHTGTDSKPFGTATCP